MCACGMATAGLQVPISATQRHTPALHLRQPCGTRHRTASALHPATDACLAVPACEGKGKTGVLRVLLCSWQEHRVSADAVGG
jgi:DNA integrity scanning protein DisA with diadenylate cyclase activity